MDADDDFTRLMLKYVIKHGDLLDADLALKILTKMDAGDLSQLDPGYKPQ